MTTKVGLYRDKRNKHRPWVVRWFGEYDPEKGKQRHYSKAFARKRDAEAFRAATQAEMNRGSPRDQPEEISVGEFAGRFFATKGKTHRNGTRLVYRNTLEQLEAHFGTHTPLRQIRPELADRFIARSLSE